MSKKSTFQHKLLPLGIASALLVSTPGLAMAAVDAYVTQGKDMTSTYSYQLSELKTSMRDNLIDPTLPGGGLWKHFMDNKQSILSLHDDKNGYISFGDVKDAFEDAFIAGTPFSVNTYTESDEAEQSTDLPATVSGVTLVDGDLKIVETPVVGTELTVSSVSAVNSTITVTLADALTETPANSDFTVKQVINGGEALNVTPHVTNLDTTGKIVTMTVTPVTATKVDQSVVYSVSYKGGVSISAESPVTVAKDITAPTVDSLVASNLTITGGLNSWDLTVGATPTAVIGEINLSFSEAINKSTLSDIDLRVYSGTDDVTPADSNSIKNILFDRFDSGPADIISGNINLTYSALKSVMNISVDSTVTSLEIDVSDPAGNITTLTLTVH